MPYTSLHGYNYVVNFIDHYSQFGMCFFMRTQDEVPEKLKIYLSEMKRFGYDIETISTDPGSTYFEQHGETHQDRDRRISAFREICEAQTPKVRHVVQPTEDKEKIAEIWNKKHFDAANTMLWHAHLSPVFWSEAVAYSQYLENRTPLSDDTLSPWEIVTGERPRFDKMKVFGCDVYEHIPNNPIEKVPGLPRGRKLLFMGFDHSQHGWRLFDPETRRFFNSTNCYFYEGMTHRVDALRHFDHRRELLKKGEEQPLVIDDFEYDTFQRMDSVRSLYTDPNRQHSRYKKATSFAEGADSEHGTTTLSRGHTPGALSRQHVSDGEHQPIKMPDQRSSGGGEEVDSGNDSGYHSDDDVDDNKTEDEMAALHGPLTEQAIQAQKVRQLISSSQVLRPLRLTRIGIPLKKTTADQEFLDHAREHDIPLKFHSPCPKKITTESGKRYLKYMHAKTYSEAIALGATKKDIEWDYFRGHIVFPKHEPDLPGHVFNAFDVASRYGYKHILEDYSNLVSKSHETDFKLAKVCQAFLDKDREHKFEEILKKEFKADDLLKLFEERERALQWAESQVAKVFNAQERKIDFLIAPEPTRFEQVQPGVCAEADKWKEAMDDEIHSMVRFGVFTKVTKAQAKGRQVLGCRWVYKRKTGSDGMISRYRARLVAQGFLQRPYDSFDPDETFSPVVSKDSLRLFLSICAAENLKIYQADVKAAFLQAPLAEQIYMRAPPGYATHDENGEEEVWLLNNAIYGLKQASNCFWNAMHEHLKSKGFESMMGDPCLFRKVLPNGKVIIACTYVDDITFGVSDDVTADAFMAELRERFVIDEGEGKPINWLLGMSVTQDIDQGIVHMNMEIMIEKLARGILTDEEITKSSSVKYPILVTPLPKQEERSVTKEEFDYLSVVGSLLHISNCVRCDIALAVGILARHSATPGPAHVKAAKRVLMYLLNTKKLGITYKRDLSIEKSIPVIYEGAKHPLDNGTNLLSTFADSDFAGDDTRRSTIGMVIMMNGGPISWCSVLGKTVALSTCEAEVNAACVAAKDALHLSRLLKDMGITKEITPLQIAEDNSACIAQANSGLRFVRKAKHYEVKLRFLQQLVVDKEISFVYCPTNNQLADMFTKPLEEVKFVGFRDMIFGAQKN